MFVPVVVSPEPKVASYPATPSPPKPCKRRRRSEGASIELEIDAIVAANVSGCDTSPTVSTGSNKHAGAIVEGTSATSCTVTFPTSYGQGPFCAVSAQDGSAIGYSTGLGVLNISHLQASSRIFQYICGWQ